MENHTHQNTQNHVLVQTFGDQKRWVNYRFETVGGKITKVPYSVTGRKASTTDSATWSTYSEVIRVSDKTGIVFLPDQKLLGIDIDHCLKDGALVHKQKEVIADLIRQSGTYTEISPSGEGLHLFLNITEPLPLIANKKAPFECYTSGRYFTVTGIPYGEVRIVRTVTKEEATRLLGIIGYPWAKTTQEYEQSKTVSSADDSLILEKMFSSKNGVKIKALYNGDIAEYNGDDSSADMALCNHLAFWTAKDAGQMERIWLASPLGSRKKTQKRKDYRDKTITASIMNCKGTYSVGNTAQAGIPTPQKYDFISLGDLLDEPDEAITWILEGVLPTSGFSIIVAKPKVGKSTWSRQLALSVAQGNVFMNRQTSKGAVLYIALEEKRSEVKKHFILLGATGDEDLHVYVGNAPKEAQTWLTNEIQKRKPLLVIIDTLFRFVNIADGNDYAKVTAALTPLLTLARDHKAHLLVVHHARKGGGDGGDSMLGSTAIFGSVDTAIILKRSEDKRTIETRQRYGTDTEPTVLLFDEKTRAMSLGGTKEQDDTQKISDEILNFLLDQTEPCVEKIVEDGIEGRTGIKRKTLRDLFAKGMIQRIGAGKRNDPYLYSRSLVPAIYGEQEKQDTKSEENTDIPSTDSRSRDLPTIVVPETINKERNPDDFEFW